MGPPRVRLPERLTAPEMEPMAESVVRLPRVTAAPRATLNFSAF